MNIRIVRIDFIKNQRVVAQGHGVVLNSKTKVYIDRAFLQKNIDFRRDRIGEKYIDINEISISGFNELNVIKRNDGQYPFGFKASDDIATRIILKVNESDISRPYQMDIDSTNLLSREIFADKKENIVIVKNGKLLIHYIAHLDVRELRAEKQIAMLETS